MRKVSETPDKIDQATRELLDRRAQRLRTVRVSEEQAEDTQLAVAEFLVGDELFAFPLAVMRGVVPLKRVTPVPLSPASVIGVFRFHGQITTAMSLPSLLGGRSWRTDPSVLVVAELSNDRLIGFDCEQVPRPGSIPRSALKTAQVGPADAPWSEVALPGRPTTRVLDIGRLVARAQGGSRGS